MRKNLLNLHLMLGGFFLPVGLMFAITGGLYTFGFKGSYITKSWEVPAEANLSVELPYLLGVADEILKAAELKAPRGSATVKGAGRSWQFEWMGAGADFILEPTDDPARLKAQYKTPNGHRFFVQLHKAKGGLPFKILAGAFALGLIALLITGFMMAFASPIYLNLALKSLGAGLAVTFIAMFLS
ncbi:MAG: PepSY domain-containing protein [Bdellovibrionota bacterium]